MCSFILNEQVQPDVRLVRDKATLSIKEALLAVLHSKGFKSRAFLRCAAFLLRFKDYFCLTIHPESLSSCLPTKAVVVNNDSNEGGFWWARLGLNQRPLRCQRSALPLSYAPDLFMRGIFGLDREFCNRCQAWVYSFRGAIHQEPVADFLIRNRLRSR